MIIFPVIIPLLTRSSRTPGGIREIHDFKHWDWWLLEDLRKTHKKQHSSLHLSVEEKMEVDEADHWELWSLEDLRWFYSYSPDSMSQSSMSVEDMEIDD